jgi:aspartokinase-like uncharacterized kinase
MVDNTAIFKIGGGIIENDSYIKSTISQLNHLYREHVFQKIILISGGGSYANFIRYLDKSLNLGDDISHWMAIHAMNYNGKLLSKKFSELKIVDNFKNLIKNEFMFTIFLPYETLKKEDILPHKWEVTSDSIALYFANKLGLQQCFLIKEVDGIANFKNEIVKEITTSELKVLKQTNKLARIDVSQENLKTSRPIDAFSLELIDMYRIPCIIISGTNILKYFTCPNSKIKVYTKIFPS